MQSKENFLIYGCYGYTGSLITDYAIKQGLKPVLAGRDEAKVKALADRYGLEFKVFDLSDVDTVVPHLLPFKAVIHCAGPFIKTVEVMSKACLKSQTTYLDITGEYQVFEEIFRLDEKAKQAGILMMPGVGFDVVPTDCLSVYLKGVLPTAEKLELALLQKGGRLSHGTALTVLENMGDQCMVRRKGKLVQVKQGFMTRTVNFIDREREVVAISWGDISTAFRSTKIPNITVYNHVPHRVIDSMRLSNYIGFVFKIPFVKRYLAKTIKSKPPGPNDEQRRTAQSYVWGEVKNGFGITRSALLELPEGYTLTALCAVEIVKRVLNGLPDKGAKTPAQVFGADFILQFPGVKRVDINS